MKKTLTELFQIIGKKNKNKFFLIFFLMIISMCLEVLGIGLIVPLIVFLTQDINSELYLKFSEIAEITLKRDFSREDLFGLGLVVLLLAYIIKNLYLVFFAHIESKFVWNVKADLSKKLFSNYMSRPYLFHIKANSGKLINNVAKEVPNFSHALIAIITILSEIIILFGILIFLVLIEPKGTVIVFLVTLIAGLLYYLSFKKKIFQLGKDRHELDKSFMANLQQGLKAIKIIKIFSKENRFVDIFDKYNVKSSEKIYQQMFLAKIPRLYFEIVAVVTLVLFSYILINQINDLKEILPILAVFGAAAVRVMPSGNRILTALSNVRFILPVFDLLKYELNKTNDSEKYLKQKENREITNNQINFESKIKFKNLSFSYPDANSNALKDINIEIKKGNIFGIMGKSGSGKSTMLDLLLGLIKPSKGNITVDDQNIWKNLESWKNLVGYVPQSLSFIDDTIKKNIAFGLDEQEINSSNLNKSINDSDLNGFIKTLNKGIDTHIGEEGLKVSGGQRQRIALARALYFNPKIILLDEATSALDDLSESFILNTIMKLKFNKTIIIVSHKKSTMKNCDIVFNLDDNKITENKS